jgi:hypothetical protein
MFRKMVVALLFPLFAMPGIGRAADAEFERLDRDKDGRVSQEEFLRWYPVEAWKKVDGQGKGSIEETEWIPVRESVKQYRRQQARDAEVKQ